MNVLSTILIIVGCGFFAFIKYGDNSSEKLKIFLIGVGLFVGGLAILIAVNYRPYNPKAAARKQKQQLEDQWIQENFGNGKGQAIYDAIDSYKQNN